MDASVCTARMREMETVNKFPNQIKMAEPLPPYTDVLTLLQALWHSRLYFPKSLVFIWTPVSARMREIEIVYNFPNQIKMAEPLPPLH
jgi:hypothetical protein